LARQILAIYLGERSIEYVFVLKGIRAARSKAPAKGLDPKGIIKGDPLICLRELLEAISHRAMPEIYIGLHRGLFFVRELRLPRMSTEEALESVQSNLSLVCHLPVEEINLDVHICPLGQNAINALIFYCPKNRIRPIVDLLDNFGLRKGLRAIMPFSYALFWWLKRNAYPLESLVSIPMSTGEIEMALYGKKGIIYSATCSDSDTEKRLLADNIGAKYTELPHGLISLENKAKDLAQNRACAVACAAVASRRPLSLQDARVTLRPFRPMKLVVPVLVAIFVGLSGITWNMVKEINAKTSQLQSMSSKIEQLRKRIAPMEKELVNLKRSAQVASSVEKFIDSRPRLFDTLNEIAIAVPEGTWFSRLTYTQGRINLTGTGPDALRLVEALRKSDLFEQVKLIGSVSRRPGGQERFSLAIILREKGEKAVSAPVPEKR